MIDLYTSTTPNGRKISIMLEELGVPYEVHPIELSRKEQFDPEFVKISPNAKIPAIVDRDTGRTMMESGAILMYLAEKYGKFMPTGEAKWEVIEWLMWQMGNLGPYLGQVHHFARHNPGKDPYGEERYLQMGYRLYGVLDRRLADRDYIAGDGRGEYTITDIACWPWISRFEWHRLDLNDYPNVRDWYVKIAARPAVQRGYVVPRFVTEVPMP